MQSKVEKPINSKALSTSKSHLNDIDGTFSRPQLTHKSKLK